VGLKLTVLGSSAAWSERPGRPSSAYLVEHPEGAIVLDLGQGALSSVFGQRDPSTLDAVVISHEHGDHHVDLIPLRHLLRYGYEEPRRIGLHVPDELRRRYDAFNGEDGFLDDLVGPELVPGVRDIGPFVIESQRVMHSEMSYAFRVTEGGMDGAPGLVYSGDCGRADDLRALIRPGDTLLCEAFWSTREAIANANHLTARQAAQVAQDGQAGSLILTHILDAHDPAAALDEARCVFRGPVSLAEPSLVVELDGAAA
jgi:ribonuclease BN (tRNA processing enzyme)